MTIYLLSVVALAFVGTKYFCSEFAIQSAHIPIQNKFKYIYWDFDTAPHQQCLARLAIKAPVWIYMFVAAFKLLLNRVCKHHTSQYILF